MFLLYKIHLLSKLLTILVQSAVFILQSLQDIDFVKIIKNQYIWVWAFSVLVFKLLEALTRRHLSFYSYYGFTEFLLII